jgi:hypothetical protein
MLPANPFGAGTPLLNRGTPVAPIAPPGSFGNDKGPPMPLYSMAPKTVPNVPQINPGPTGNLPNVNAKPMPDVPQINPGPTGNLPAGRAALVRSVMARTGGMGKPNRQPQYATQPQPQQPRRPFPRPPGG